MTEAQIKLLADLRSGAVLASVKPLGWKKDGLVGGHGGWLGRAGSETRAVKIGWAIEEPFEFGAQTFATLEAAQAAAQADYEARILSALSPSPDLASLAEMIEGLVGERDGLLKRKDFTASAYERELRASDSRVSELQAENEKLAEALAWYQCEAEALTRYASSKPPNTTAMGATMQVLALDAGRRAARALAKDHPNGQG